MLDIKNPLVVGKGNPWPDIYAAIEAITGRDVERSDFQDIARKAGYDGIFDATSTILTLMKSSCLIPNRSRSCRRKSAISTADRPRWDYLIGSLTGIHPDREKVHAHTPIRTGR